MSDDVLFHAVSLPLISESVLARLADGRFVPERSREEAGAVDHSIHMFKKCVRLEPAVFLNRLDTLLQAAHWLNDPGKRLFWVGGDYGMGKTSFSRALAELTRPEAVYWMECPLDAELFVQQLALCLRPVTLPGDGSPDLFALIKEQLPQQGERLLVLNHAERLCNPQGHLLLPEHKPLLDALLSTGTIKLVWSGERFAWQTLPAPLRLMMTPIPLDIAESLLLRVTDGQAPTSEWLPSLVHATGGAPWRIRLLWRLLKNPQTSHCLSELAQPHGPLEQRLLRLLQAGWQAEDAAWLAILASVRLPLTARQLDQVLSLGFPEQTLTRQPVEFLEKSPFATFIRRLVPAQLVQTSADIQRLARYELVPPVRQWVLQQSLAFGQAHRGLLDFYAQEKDQPVQQRGCSIRFLRREQDYHQLQAAQYPALPESPPILPTGGGAVWMGGPSRQAVDAALAQKDWATAAEQLKGLLHHVIEQGDVLQQLELLSLLVTTYQKANLPQLANTTLQHAWSLAHLCEQTHWIHQLQPILKGRPSFLAL